MIEIQTSAQEISQLAGAWVFAAATVLWLVGVVLMGIARNMMRQMDVDSRHDTASVAEGRDG